MNDSKNELDFQEKPAIKQKSRLGLPTQQQKNSNTFLENPQEQKIIPEHAKKIALAKMDLMKQWFEFRKKSNNKFKADYEFVQLYNTSNSNIFSILGEISRGTLHRWEATLT